MLKYIKIKNFLSFKELTEIFFESSNYGGKKDNVFDIISSGKKNTLMKSMLIYGANASGKTNLIRAIVVIRNFAMRYPIFPAPFLLDIETKTKPSFFEIGFFIGNKEYKYNFELGGVISENLFEVKKGKDFILFQRKQQDVIFDNYFTHFRGQLEDKVKEGVSFLWVLDQFNGKLNGKTILHFFNHINSLGNAFDGLRTVDLLKLNESEKNKRFVLEFLKCADIDICDIKIEETLGEIIDFNLDKKDVKFSQGTGLRIEFGHKIKGSNEIQYFPLANESQGTQKLFGILGMIIITILDEGILFFDEIEGNLHPHIVKNLFNLIHNDLGKQYQFIFTTHSIELMNLKNFKKEQIGITEKDLIGGTKFYTLYDFEDIRSENDIQKLYNLGSLGGVPIVRDFSSLMKEIQLGEDEKN